AGRPGLRRTPGATSFQVGSGLGGSSRAPLINATAAKRATQPAAASQREVMMGPPEKGHSCSRDVHLLFRARSTPRSAARRGYTLAHRIKINAVGYGPQLEVV